MKKILSLAVLSALATPTMALPPIQEPGFNGEVNLGLGGGELESNFLAKIDGLDIDLGEDPIDSLDSPGAESLTMGVANLDIGWTFSGGNTRISLGNELGDVIDFDRAVRLSLRHDFDSLAQVRVDYLTSPGLAPTQVWADPYVTGENREETDREMSGARIIVDRILGTGFGYKGSVRNIDIDDELSGEALGLSRSERLELDREGDTYRHELSYEFQLNDHNILRPSIQYIDKDLDGAAMKQDGYSVQLRHVYKSDHMVWASAFSYTDLDGDRVNPIFNEVNDAESFVFATKVSFPGSIDFLGKWVPNIAVTYGDEDSDVDFNDNSVWLVSAAVSRRF